MYPSIKEHKGLFVALYLPQAVAERLALPGGEPAEELHVTLCYCGDVAVLGAETVARAIAAIAGVVSRHRALTGKISGTGRFNASATSDGKDVFYASVDVPGLTELRVEMVHALTEAGAPPRSDHGWAPHVTLSYIDPDDQNPVEKLPPIHLRLDAITVIAGDQRALFPLLASDEDVMNDKKEMTVKFADNSTNKIVGIGVPFGGPFHGKDFHGEFFSERTDLALDWFAERPLLYAHGMHDEVQIEVVGRVKAWKLEKGKGWSVEAELDKSKKYFADIKKLIDEDALYFSSGSVPHLVQVDKKSGEILRWPWIELTLTPQPANFYADLDWAAAEKHYKDAGIEIPVAVKDAVARSVQSLSGVGIFERELAEQQQSVWRLWNAAQCGFESVAKAASVSEITGVEIDVTAKVAEIVTALSARLIPAVAAQIQEYIESDREQPFYVKAVSLDALINGNSRVGLPLANHLEQVHAAVAGVIKRADGLRQMRSSTKEGKVFSSSNLGKLQGLHAQMGECHQKMGELIESAQTKPKEKQEEAAKTAASSRRELNHRHLSLKQFELNISGDQAATEAK